MAVIINASTSTGLVQSADTSGIIQFQSNGSTKATLNSSGFSYPGAVLQVLQAVKTNTFSIASSTLADITGLSVTITPSSASNKILVIVDLHISYSVYAGIVHLLRGATKIYAGDGGLTRCGLYSNIYYGGSGHTLLPVTATFLDSPATTSATTYKLQTANYGNGTQYVNRTGDDISNETNRDGLTASSITVMEISV